MLTDVGGRLIAAVRLIRTYPNATFVPAVRATLGAHLTAANLQAEAAYMTAPGRTGFERPYGLAWVLQLVAELAEWAPTDADAARVRCRRARARARARARPRAHGRYGSGGRP
jgi:hypothetical protein